MLEKTFIYAAGFVLCFCHVETGKGQTQTVAAKLGLSKSVALKLFFSKLLKTKQWFNQRVNLFPLFYF